MNFGHFTIQLLLLKNTILELILESYICIIAYMLGK